MLVRRRNPHTTGSSAVRSSHCFAARPVSALNGAQTQSVTLANGERKTVLIPVRALNGFGQGDLGLTISGMVLPNEELPDYQHHWKIGVRPAYPAQTRHFANVLRSGESWSLPVQATAGLSAETLQGQLLITSRPPLNLARYISELYAYPYGCLEQTVSGLYPSLYSNHAQLTALGIKADSDEKRRQTIDVGIEHLLSMQRYNGGFGLWSNDILRSRPMLPCWKFRQCWMPQCWWSSRSRRMQQDLLQPWQRCTS